MARFDRRIDALRTARQPHHRCRARPLVGTSSFIGEGFDCPALDTLFLAAPITFKNRLVQYVECLTRLHPATATVHDIHDELTPVFADSVRKRAPGYTKLGFPAPESGPIDAPEQDG